jgi:hypothetical protein
MSGGAGLDRRPEWVWVPSPQEAFLPGRVRSANPANATLTVVLPDSRAVEVRPWSGRRHGRRVAGVIVEDPDWGQQGF